MDIFLMFAGTILVLVLLMLAIMWAGFWMRSRKRTLSPYTGLPLRSVMEISFSSLLKIQEYLSHFTDYDNKMFKVKRAAFCRETGRIFPLAITWFGEINIDWNFLQKRCSGNWISWGSLNKLQRDAIKDKHRSLEGFQTEFSCPNPSPRNIDDKYVYYKPGPLYVDLETGILLGWKVVPGTELEVMIVQKPTK